MTEAFNLVREGTDKVIAKACGKCGRVYGLKENSFGQSAQTCCAPLTCYRCGTLAPSRATIGWRCKSCNLALRKESQDRQLKRTKHLYQKATKIPLKEYSGKMLVDPSNIERFLEVDDDLYWDENLRWNDDEEGNSGPLWFWATTPTKIVLDAYDVVSSAVEEWYEGAAENFDTEALQKLLDAWAAEQEVYCHWIDEGRVVVCEEEV